VFPDKAVAKYCQTEGVCLRRLDYSDTSQVATFLTRDSGRLSFIAKGLLRAPKRGISTGLELLGLYRLLYTERRSGALCNLTEAYLLESPRGIGQKVERILCGYYAVELMLHFTAEGEPCLELYELLLDCLRCFQKGEGLGLSVLVLELGALRHHGVCPTFEQCVRCDRSVPSEGSLLFSLSEGGPICAACARRLPSQLALGAVPVRAERLALLAGLACAGKGDQKLARPAAREVVAASRLLRLHMRYLLDRELRMWKYLQGRHLSRTLGRIRRAGG